MHRPDRDDVIKLLKCKVLTSISSLYSVYREKNLYQDIRLSDERV